MFNLEMNSKRDIYLCECDGILEYSDDDILLDFGEFAVRISGAELSMVSYISGEIYIEGEILRIEFESKSDDSDSAAKEKLPDTKKQSSRSDPPPIAGQNEESSATPNAA